MQHQAVNYCWKWNGVWRLRRLATTFQKALIEMCCWFDVFTNNVSSLPAGFGNTQASQSGFGASSSSPFGQPGTGFGQQVRRRCCQLNLEVKSYETFTRLILCRTPGLAPRNRVLEYLAPPRPRCVYVLAEFKYVFHSAVDCFNLRP